jgi:hypothetical protein
MPGPSISSSDPVLLMAGADASTVAPQGIRATREARAAPAKHTAQADPGPTNGARVTTMKTLVLFTSTSVFPMVDLGRCSLFKQCHAE